MFQSGKQACIHIYIYIYQSDTEQFLSTVFLQSYEKNTYNKNNDINIRKYTRKNTFLEENIISRKTLINDIIRFKTWKDGTEGRPVSECSRSVEFSVPVKSGRNEEDRSFFLVPPHFFQAKK